MYFPDYPPVSLHLHRLLTPAGLVGLLKLVDNPDSAFSRGPVIRQMDAFGNLEFAVPNAEIIEGHESDLLLLRTALNLRFRFYVGNVMAPSALSSNPKPRSRCKRGLDLQRIGVVKPPERCVRYQAGSRFFTPKNELTGTAY